MSLKLKKKQIDELFKLGNRLQHGSFRLYYRILPKETPYLPSFIFAVSKHSGFNAVLRNHYKRRLKEIVRPFRSKCILHLPSEKNLHLALIYLGRKKNYLKMKKQLLQLFSKLLQLFKRKET